MTDSKEMPAALFKDFTESVLIDVRVFDGVTKPELISRLVDRFRKEVPGFRVPFDLYGLGSEGMVFSENAFHLLLL